MRKHAYYNVCDRFGTKISEKTFYLLRDARRHAKSLGGIVYGYQWGGADVRGTRVPVDGTCTRGFTHDGREFDVPGHGLCYRVTVHGKPI